MRIRRPISYTKDELLGEGIKAMRVVLKVFHQLNVMMKPVNLHQHDKL